MKRNVFMAGLSTVKGRRKAAMIAEYKEIIARIGSIAEEAEYDLDWQDVHDEVLDMFDFFYDRYMPSIGPKHTGHAAIKKNMKHHAGRQSLVRVMTMQIEKFADE